MTTPVELRRLVKKLGPEVKEQSPWSFATSQVGVPIEPIRDPVLMHLAKYPDQREHEAQARMHQVSGSLQHLSLTTLTHGFEVQVGESGSPAAHVLADQARAIIRGLRPGNVRDIARLLAQKVAWLGWQPVQILYEQRSMQGASTPWLVPKKLVEKPAHLVRIAADGTGRVAWLPGFAQEARLFDEEHSEAEWLLPTYGGASSPYGLGRGSAFWTLGKIILALTEKSYRSVDKQWRLLKVTAGALAGAAKDELRAEIESVEDDLRTLLELANDQNILMEVGSWKTEIVEGLNHINSVKELMAHLDTTARVWIEGQHLTAETSTSGPAGSSKTQETVLRAYALDHIASGVEDAFTELFRTVFWVNMPNEVDPMDLPAYVSRQRSALSESVAKTLFALGVPMEGRAIASAVGGQAAAALVRIPDEIQDDEILIQKPGRPAVPGFFPGPGGAAQDGPPSNPTEPPDPPAPEGGQADEGGERAHRAHPSVSNGSRRDDMEGADARARRAMGESLQRLVDGELDRFVEQSPPGKA